MTVRFGLEHLEVLDFLKNLLLSNHVAKIVKFVHRLGAIVDLALHGLILVPLVTTVHLGKMGQSPRSTLYVVHYKMTRQLCILL